MHYFKNSGMKDATKELSFFISHGLKYISTNNFYLHEMQKQKWRHNIHMLIKNRP